ncbi:MAG: tRNA pseudouridine(55) synthase TruB [Clostridia bacterium]
MNGILVVDKPEGFTSHDVVAKLRGILGTRRIGHSGTLDPMATGVLPVFVGRATRACEFAVGHDKIYKARMLLGIETDTLDITGRVTRACDMRVSDAALLGAVASQIGDIMQTPPMYSAVKIGGKRLYQLARAGVEIERPKRPVTIYKIEVERVSMFCVDLVVHASKGTYIRSLCADIGTELGCGATLARLRRIRAGAFAIEQAQGFEEIAQEPKFLPVDTLFSEYKTIELSAAHVTKAKNGALIRAKVTPGETFRVYGPNGEFLMLASAVAMEDGVFLKTIKSFFEV